MKVEDLTMIERIERLAFQAGAASSGKPMEVKPEVKLVLNKLVNIARSSPGNIGPAIFGTQAQDNLEWSDIYAMAKVF